MASDPPSSGPQPHWLPPASGSMAPQNFVPPYNMQFRPGAPQVQQFIPSQFHQAPNLGMPPGQSQHPQFSQPMQQFLPRPATPSHGVSFSSSFSFPPSSFGVPQNNVNVASQFQPSPQISAPGGQPWLHPNQTTPAVAPFQPAAGAPVPVVNGSATSQPNDSDWQEFEAADGRRYYYNKVTKQSSWEKPLELMTPSEKADSLTVWKEFTTPEGKKYYYNKETKQSKWTIPDDLKLAREQAEQTAKNSEISTSSNTPATSVEHSSIAGVNSSPIVGAKAPSILVSETLRSPPSEVPEGSSSLPVISPNANLTPVTNRENPSYNVASSPLGGASIQDIEEAKKGMAVAGKINVTVVEEKTVEDEPFIYATKQEAKNAFKALLEFANVEADWTWDQAMRVIINDKRYGALKTLGERKQAFNEYMMQRKKVEAEERRLRQRRAKEEYMKMLEESEELTSSTRWSKAIGMFEDDQRFKAVEQEADREDLFRSYLVDLHKKEKAKAQEEYRRNRLEFRQFLESCDFIKVDSQWRKVQDLLEDNEKCTRLDKIDRLDVFQDYIRDLEKEEEEQKKKEKEQLRRVERKNRDAFRKTMEEHIADGTLTAKTHWRDYCQKVKDSESYEAVALNTSGSTPRDLFEDVTEELEKKYDEDKARVKDTLKQEKITISSTWTFEDFKSSILESIGSPSITEINLQLVYEDLIDRVKEKEEKEVKKRKRLAKDFTDKLSDVNEITVTSTWEEFKPLVEDCSEYRSIGEESLCREIFDEYVTRLQEKVKEKERKREEEKAKKEREREEKERKKDKDKREKERDKDKDKEKSRRDEIDSDSMDVDESSGYKDEKRREKDKDRKHRKRSHSNADEISSEKEEKEETKKSRRHGSDRKKSRKHAYSPESDSESKHKKHRRDHRDGSRKNGGQEELEDGELGEDGEIQ